MGVYEELRQAGEPWWREIGEHPFARGIVDGSLDEERFRRWLLQDYRYLVEYARVMAMAAVRADRPETMGRYAGLAQATLTVEMGLHRRLAAGFGLDLADLEAAPAWPPTRAYADFLLRTAALGDRAELAAALLPCAFLYVELFGAVPEARLPSDRRYADFLRQYAAPELREAADWQRGELERLASDAGEATRQRCREAFLTACRHELAFVEMCWSGQDAGHAVNREP